MQIRRKNVDGKNLVVQYSYGSKYLGFCTIEVASNDEALALSALPDAELLARLKTALGAEMLADLNSSYQ
jgi:hypothetical protein